MTAEARAGNTWTPPAYANVVDHPFFGTKTKTADNRRRWSARRLPYLLHAQLAARALVPYGLPEDRVMEMSFAILCIAPSELDHGDYKFFLNSELYEDEVNEAPVEKVLSNEGPVVDMFEKLFVKMEEFVITLCSAT
mmetsp:Transcript_17922/g.39208  ORF Transcript_17922/g.39208 Transcript_17922/m.39208 type:complete len:137 (-) Transcript_17922:108-518(-)